MLYHGFEIVKERKQALGVGGLELPRYTKSTLKSEDLELTLSCIEDAHWNETLEIKDLLEKMSIETGMSQDEFMKQNKNFVRPVEFVFPLSEDWSYKVLRDSGAI